eukprot:256233-Chlamydomonas_euryale.AAC.1
MQAAKRELEEKLEPLDARVQVWGVGVTAEGLDARVQVWGMDAEGTDVEGAACGGYGWGRCQKERLL